jgi:hypothetical protein
MKYRKRPVVIKAKQFILGVTSKADMLAFCPVANIGAPIEDDTDIRWFVIPTLEGNHNAKDRDYIIEGVRGEFYPCDEEIFLETYEAVSE